MKDIRAAVEDALRACRSGRQAQARQTLDRLVAQHPTDLDVLYGHSVCAGMMGDLVGARASAMRGAQLAPRFPGFWVVLSQAHIGLQDYAAAEGAARRAAALEPGNVDCIRGLAWLVHHLNRFSEAADLARRGLELAPHDPDLWLKYASALQCLGRVDEAATIFGRAVAACPSSIDLAEGRAACSNYVTGIVRQERLGLHRHFGEMMEREAGDCRAPSPDRDAGVSRPIRVALLSSDLRSHSVAYFVHPLLQHADPRRIDLFVFHVGGVEDATTTWLRSMLPAYRWCFMSRATSSPQQVDAAIRAAAVDVCIELNGLTYDHSLRAMARRPAAMLCTYLGYPNTTGMRSIDHRIVDSRTDPGAEADGASVESLLRIDPCFLCYTPPPDAPDVAPSPCASPDAPITFGSFNMITKVNDWVLAMWCRLLGRAPNSRLVIKSRGLEAPTVQSDVRGRADATARSADIDPDRIALEGWIEGRAAHMAAYSRIDIALDTFPYHGTTTTCEALLMGVPVLTLAGDMHASRVGVSILTGVGLGEFICSNDSDYVTRAAALAGDRSRLVELRASLRQRLLASPVCDAAVFTERFFASIETAWAKKREGA
jgi:predicted O-linked N-acetylglucosamine transferase (SPINDLY family)